MKHISLLMLAAVLVGCQPSSPDLLKVWPTEKSGFVLKKHGPSIREAEPPPGFLLTPLDVSEMCKLRKYQIVIYADDINYYVAKVTASPKEAKRYGECVNGKTGDITHAKERNRHSIVHISPYKRIPNI